MNMSNLITKLIKKEILLNCRLLSVLLLGFSSGLPLALIGSTLQAWFAEAQLNLRTIGWLSLLGLPYILKFLWAPLMDHYSIFGLARRKGWILFNQLGLIVTIIFLSILNPAQNAFLMGCAALLIAFFSASQDVAIDAYRTDLLHPKEQGLGASYYIFTYRIAMLVSGGLALICADFIGWQWTYTIMASLLLCCMILTYFLPSLTEIILESSPRLLHTIQSALGDLFNQNNIKIIILFIIFYKIGDALALSLMTPFLLQGLHFTLTEIGLAYKTVSMAATILGAFVGGIYLIRLPLLRALLIFGVLQAFSNLLFALLAFVGKDFYLMILSIFVENFCSGLTTAALLALMMSLCHARFSASQFALLSAFASLGRIVLGPLASLMVEHIGWIQFYVFSFLLCFPGLVFLIFLKSEDYAHAAIGTD
jgi:PAT family beta-lactamase induction signal transducer AmpG